MAMKTIVALPGEGIGIEVVDATCELLMGTGLPLKILTPPQGAPLPEETKRAAREADGVLFGAAGPATSHSRASASGRVKVRRMKLALSAAPNVPAAAKW